MMLFVSGVVTIMAIMMVLLLAMIFDLQDDIDEIKIKLKGCDPDIQDTINAVTMRGGVADFEN